MKLSKIASRFVLVPIALAVLLAAPAAFAQDDEGWFDDDDAGYGETFEAADDNWGANYGFENQWWQDEEYEVEGASYRQDDYGYYDQDYDWNTDEQWWNDWWE